MYFYFNTSIYGGEEKMVGREEEGGGGGKHKGGVDRVSAIFFFFLANRRRFSLGWEKESNSQQNKCIRIVNIVLISLLFTSYQYLHTKYCQHSITAVCKQRPRP